MQLYIRDLALCSFTLCDLARCSFTLCDACNRLRSRGNVCPACLKVSIPNGVFAFIPSQIHHYSIHNKTRDCTDSGISFETADLLSDCYRAGLSGQWSRPYASVWDMRVLGACILRGTGCWGFRSHLCRQIIFLRGAYLHLPLFSRMLLANQRNMLLNNAPQCYYLISATSFWRCLTNWKGKVLCEYWVHASCEGLDAEAFDRICDDKSFFYEVLNHICSWIVPFSKCALKIVCVHISVRGEGRASRPWLTMNLAKVEINT